MPSFGKLLLLGHDEVLQGTRISLLESAGFLCRSVRDPGVLAVDPTPYRLVLLCHTLSAQDTHRAVELVRQTSPATTLLQLLKFACAEEACCPHVLVAPTPERLVATVQRLSTACAASR